jgi:hypothetical protein
MFICLIRNEGRDGLSTKNTKGTKKGSGLNILQTVTFWVFGARLSGRNL